jgi:molecular chaperone HscA
MVDNAALLLELLDRLVEAKDGNGWFVDGRISNAERNALRKFAGILLAAPEPPRPATPSRSDAIAIDKTLLTVRAPTTQAILCIDFGTAASKAAVSFPGYEVPHELNLGKAAGEPAMKPWVSSSIGIDAAGMIVFGPKAEACRHRISSIKSKLWDTTDEIGKEMLCVDGLSFSGAGCLVAYLAYLTQLISNELALFEEDTRVPRYVPRRYAMPFAEDPSRKDLRKRFATWLGQAQLLADTFGDKLLEGLNPAELRSALDAVQSMRAPAWFIRDDPACIGEPVAAGAFALSRDIATQALYMIVDVGAGTSDFCILAVKNRADGDSEIYRAHGSDHSVQIAGDTVDQAFQDYIREELGIGLLPSEAADLDRNRRAWKEQLFRNGMVEESVGEDQVPLSIDLDSFLASSQWQQVEAALAEAQKVCFRNTDRNWINQWGVGPIRVVLTGGGAKLPLKKVLAEGRVNDKQVDFMRIPQDPLPPSFAAAFDEPDDLPRLIVALGGSIRNPPTEHDRTLEKVNTSPVPRWGPAVLSKNDTDIEGR